MAKQCPRCELRFLVDAEVRDHLIDDHGMLPEQLEHPYPRPGRAGPRSRPDPRDEEDQPGERD
ncbi:MAG: hypothetical protein ACRDZ4_11910 [Egibacteraceae bacterium]